MKTFYYCVLFLFLIAICAAGDSINTGIKGFLTFLILMALIVFIIAKTTK